MANILCLITNSMSHNKKVIITGASKGIGEAICMRLLKQNYSVVAICRSAPNIPGVEHMACDLSDRTERSTAFKSLACHGPIYGLVNNAGVATPNLLEDFDPDIYDTVMSINATSVCVKWLLKEW